MRFERSASRGHVGPIELIALGCLVLGWLAFGYGTAVAVVALVASRRWNPVEKLIGAITAILSPVGMVIAGMIYVGGEAAPSSAATFLLVPVVLLLTLVAPCAVATFLWQRLRGRGPRRATDALLA